MSHEEISLPEDPAAAVAALEQASADAPVVVFKQSPICPVSTMAEGNFRSWLASREAGPLKVVFIDVIAQRPLARGLTEALGIRHESPQALVFKDGTLVWDDSHGALTEDAFSAEVG